MLASVATFLRARRADGHRWWIASWALALGAALTKEMAVALPFAVAGLEAWLRARRAQLHAPPWRLAPYFAVVPLVVWTAQHPLGPGRVVAHRIEQHGEIAEAQGGDYEG